MPFKEFLFFAGFLVFWVVLNRWVLPWFGVATCMSGACGVDPRRAAVHRSETPVGPGCSCGGCCAGFNEADPASESQQEPVGSVKKGDES